MDRGKKRRGFGESHAGAERKGPVLVGDCVEASDPAEPDDALEVAQLLRDPEADVGCAPDQRCVGETFVERSETLNARGRSEELALVADAEVSIVCERCERRGAVLICRGEAVSRRAVTCRERRRQDRTISGAAAKIAGKLIA